MNKLKILIVDDNIHFLKAFQFILQNDYSDIIEDITLAKNGKECLEILKNQTIDIIFMDIDMPKMDGVEATKRIIDQFRGIKIIAISFHSELNEIKRMLEAGARNYIIKEEISKEALDRCLVCN
mgnify:CR=1 FL=1